MHRLWRREFSGYQRWTYVVRAGWQLHSYPRRNGQRLGMGVESSSGPMCPSLFPSPQLGCPYTGAVPRARTHSLLPQGSAGGAGAASQHRGPLYPPVCPGSCLCRAAAAHVGTEAVALSAATELPAHVAEVGVDTMECCMCGAVYGVSSWCRDPTYMELCVMSSLWGCSMHGAVCGSVTVWNLHVCGCIWAKSTMGYCMHGACVVCPHSVGSCKYEIMCGMSSWHVDATSFCILVLLSVFDFWHLAGL